MLVNYDVPGQSKRPYSESFDCRDSLMRRIYFISRYGVREDHTASYFNHDNADATRSRDQLASDSLEMLIQWLKDGGNVGIHGALSYVSRFKIALNMSCRCYKQHKKPSVGQTSFLPLQYF